jgi:hypothetical protein
MQEYKIADILYSKDSLDQRWQFTNISANLFDLRTVRVKELNTQGINCYDSRK